MSATNIIPPNRKLVTGLGSALVDILIHESDDFVLETGTAKGGMDLVEKDFIHDILFKSKAKPMVVPGGSACNTIVGICCLGGQGRFVGKRGIDRYGNLFEEDLKKNQVEPLLFKSASPTGRVLSVITPDAQRTMYTYLGASSETDPIEITEECFAGSAIVHLEGYLVFNQNLMLKALESAKKGGAVVSLDLASFTIVEQSKAFLDRIIREYVDILIANEDEARIFTGFTDEKDAISSLSQKAEIAVLKVGKRGSYIAEKGNIIKVKAHGSEDIIDTTGAGDLWASGFLYGIINGFSFEKCGEVASACGYEVCRVIGASIPEEGWNRIRAVAGK